jgi:hypothetical protein
MYEGGHSSRFASLGDSLASILNAMVTFHTVPCMGFFLLSILVWHSLPSCSPPPHTYTQACMHAHKRGGGCGGIKVGLSSNCRKRGHLCGGPVLAGHRCRDVASSCCHCLFGAIFHASLYLQCMHAYTVYCLYGYACPPAGCLTAH